VAAVLPSGSLRWVAPDTESRARDAFLALAATGWLTYTYFYPSLHLAHAALPACPFLTLTGHPCPLCGGTRSFSAIWRGDIGASLHLYPVGPLLFVTCVGVAAYAVVALVTRRSLAVRLSRRVERWITVAGLAMISSSWALKLIWLGN